MSRVPLDRPAPDESAMETEEENVHDEVVSQSIPEAVAVPLEATAEGAEPVALTVVDRSCDENDDGLTCPICLDAWTNAGEHRLCSLKCGHLFGHSCIVRWLASQQKKSCPSCKKKVVRHNDIRFIYARKLIAMDTTELEAIKEDLANVTSERNKLQYDIGKYVCREQCLNQEINALKSELNSYKMDAGRVDRRTPTVVGHGAHDVKLYMEKAMEVCPLSGCRVFDSNPKLDLLAVNAKAPNALFSGFGLRKISTVTFKPLAFLPLHSAQIRDVTFENARILTVSMDKTAKSTDLISNANVFTLNESVPLWSCCWDASDSNCFYVGTQMGAVMKYDVRHVDNGPLDVFAVPGDMSPVISVAHLPIGSVPGAQEAGLVSCKLNSLWYFENARCAAVGAETHRRHPMAVDGPFYAFRFDRKREQFVVSSRPNSRNPNSRHSLGYLRMDERGERLSTNIVHTFESVGIQRHMSRSCFVKIAEDDGDEAAFVATHEESSRVVSLWDVKNGKRTTTVPAHDPILDLNAVVSSSCSNVCWLVGLTEKKLMFYKFA